MKQKYQISINKDEKTVTLREFAELDKDILSPLCEETYDLGVIEAAFAKDRDTLLAVLRTKNMYPPGSYAERIAVTMEQLLQSDKETSAELFFDDIELLRQEREEIEMEQALEEEADDIDDLLSEDDFEEEFESKDDIKKINTSLKVADDEYGDLDEET